MKTLKYLLWTFLAAAFATACTDDPTYTSGAEEDPNTYGVYFPTQTSPTEVEVSSTQTPEITYKVCRTRALEAISVPIVVSTSEEGIFELDDHIFFGPGETETEFTVSFPNAKKGVEYTCDIRIEDPHYIYVYGPKATSLSFSVIRADWVLVTSEDGTITKGKWRDDLISNIYSTTGSGFNPNPEVEVEIYERDDKPGLYRMKVYNAAFMTALSGSSNLSYQCRDLYTTIDATNPQKVYIPYQSTGLGLLTADGEIRIASNVSENFSMDESTSQYGTMEDGVITFPVQSIMLELEKQAGAFFYGNISGLLRIQMPGIKAPDYTVKLTKHEPENGVVDIDAEFVADAKVMKYALYEGVVDDGQASLYAQDLDAQRDKPDTFEGSISATGTIKIEGLKTGKYTLVGCVYDDEKEGMKSYAFVSFGYVAPGEEKKIDLNWGLEKTNEYAGMGVSSENAARFYAYGSEIESLVFGIFRSDRFDSSLIDDMLKAQGDALSAEELAKINDGYFSIMLTGLNGDTEYTFVMQVNNGYYTETMTAQYETDGTFNPGLEYYLYEDFYENSQQPTVEELTGTTWNYYATNLMDDNAKRRKIGQVTMTLDPELSTESGSVMRIKGLSGIEFWEGGDLLGTYIPQNSTYSGYTGALSLSSNDNYSEGVYNGQTVYPAFLPSDNSGVYFGECMFIGAVADGYLYCIPSPRAQDLGGKSFTHLFTGSTYDLFSLMTEMMLVDPEKDLGGISETAQKNIAAMREKVMNGLQPRNFVELPEFAAQPALSQRERPLPLNAATGRFPVPAPAAKRAQAKFSTGAISSPAAGPEMTFTRIGKKVE